MRERWQKLAERFNALQPRERALVLIAVVVGTIMIFDAVMFQPAEARKKVIERQIKQARQQVKETESLMKTKQSVGDSHAVKRTYRDALRGRLAEINQNMKGLQEGMVPPERMARLLEGVLARTSGLQLLSLRALPPRAFAHGDSGAAQQSGKKTKKPAKGPEHTIYEHSFELTLQGTYNELYDYLGRLEKLPWRMFWNRLSVRVERDLVLRVTIRVQTLSLTKAWLVV